MKGTVHGSGLFFVSTALHSATALGERATLFVANEKGKGAVQEISEEGLYFTQEKESRTGGISIRE